MVLYGLTLLPRARNPQVFRLCRDNSLHSALIYVNNRALNDYVAPACELLAAYARAAAAAASQPAAEDGAAELTAPSHKVRCARPLAPVALLLRMTATYFACASYLARRHLSRTASKLLLHPPRCFAQTCITIDRSHVHKKCLISPGVALVDMGTSSPCPHARPMAKDSCHQGALSLVSWF